MPLEPRIIAGGVWILAVVVILGLIAVSNCRLEPKNLVEIIGLCGLLSGTISIGGAGLVIRWISGEWPTWVPEFTQLLLYTVGLVFVLKWGGESIYTRFSADFSQ